MGSDNRKIYRLTIVLICSLLIFSGSALFAQSSDAATWDVERLKVPIYQEGRDHPILILYGEAAKPVGLRFELKGVKLDWLGESVTEIKGTVETPTAVYNQATKNVTGNEKITYRSKEVDINGVGFDIDQDKQIIHIRSKVEVILKGDLSSTKQTRQAKGKGKGKIKPGGLSLVPTTEKGKAAAGQKNNSKFKQLLNEITVKKKNVKDKDK